jgi:hypothetical protein
VPPDSPVEESQELIERRELGFPIDKERFDRQVFDGRPPADR